jgi:TonB-linked SusC/RagA family outer membrane protein
MKQKLLVVFLLSMGLFSSAFAQNRKISGKITAVEDGLPLPGVSVKIQGSKLGTSTSADGSFSLSVPETAKVLEFSFTGYLSKTLPLTTLNMYNAQLSTDTKTLSEVVIRDSYGSYTKQSYVGSASIISGAVNENKPTASPINALQGQVAGLNVTVGSGQPGAEVQVRLRGLGSTALSSNPLYVVDGMIINSGDLSRNTTTSNVLAGINSDDIENITVLKDASATAIYGSRGSNGVIIITTKRGKSGKTAIRFDAESGINTNLSLPDAGKPLTAAQYKELYAEGLTNAGYSAAQVATSVENYGMNSGKSNDWYDVVTKDGSQQQYNVSVAGGTENTKIFTSAGYFKQEATTVGSSLKRINGLFNVDHNISKRFTLSTGLNVSNVAQLTPSASGAYANPILAAYFLRPFQLAYAADGSVNDATSGNTNFASIYNPLYVAANDVKSLSQTRILGNASLKWDIWDKLKYTSYVSIDYNTLEESEYNNPTMGDGSSSSGASYQYYTRFFNWLTRNQLDYSWKVPGVSDLTVDATLGYEAQRSKEYDLSASGTGFPATTSLTALAVTATPTSASAENSNYSFNSLYSRLNMRFQGKYGVSATFRRDGSSLFGENNRFGNFWSVGGSWNIDQEKFFAALQVLSSAKARISYGTSGNAQGLDNYGSRALAAYGYNYANANGQQYSEVGNPDLTWETSHKFDAGIDFGFFNNRLTFSVDYYRNLIDGLIQSVAISGTTGFTTTKANSGAMMNRGFELGIKAVPVETKNFTWNTSFNISTNHNEVTKIGNASGVHDSYYYLAEGYDYNTYYTRLYAGVDASNGDALWYTDGSKTATTNSYSEAERVAYKSASPKFFGGFNNNFSYKGFTLGVDFYYNYGNYIVDSWSKYLNDGTYSTFNKYQYVYTNRWTTPGQVTDVPKYVAGGGTDSNSSAYSSRFIYKGDYIRLKNLTVGYDFKNINYLRKKLGISKLYLYMRGTNLWTKTYDDRLTVDPEASASATSPGISSVSIPQIKSYTVGLNVGF